MSLRGCHCSAAVRFDGDMNSKACLTDGVKWYECSCWSFPYALKVRPPGRLVTRIGRKVKPPGVSILGIFPMMSCSSLENYIGMFTTNIPQSFPRRSCDSNKKANGSMSFYYGHSEPLESNGADVSP